ncbi:YheC/YheD family protein [Pullulanibacillus sp. KACC 23026]|uniref:YheC/YheD family endospore coat-associated protein n=1 Tax=Pullulanibacillus sp. KACC 23026 TaxID=3028315 RepID=UPI0023AF8C12|nr:YheC/YheD family protein [Pullulanibacillus sp. KACC 23026]WEG12055.1 YheC/YheD family protein [Pullulanibacillus sp. KACC 23026]
MTKHWFTSVMKEKSQSIRVPTNFAATDIHYVQFGRKVLPCDILLSDGTEFQISEDLWELLRIPRQTQFRYVQEDSTLRLLPLIGLFTPHLQRGAKEPLGTETAIQQKWLKMTQDLGGVAFLFDGKHINFNEGTLEGWVLADGEWKKMELPLPDVVYDRTPNRYMERHPLVKEIRSLFEQDYDIPWFNQGFFDKWTTYTLLEKASDGLDYLPETRVYNKPNFIKMLENHDFLYLKPRNKSKGAGIISIEANESGYLIKSYHHQQLKKQKVQTKRDLWQTIHQLIKKPDKYIIQKGIRLILYQNHPVDFRIHTNKDRNGRWQLSAIAGKRAGAEQLTTHLTYGGKVIPLTKLFNQEQLNESFEQLKTAALRLSEALSRQMDEKLGELGFDLGIDQTGQIWLFEVNAKPRHHIFLSPSIRHQLKGVHQYWLDYSQFLAEYRTEMSLLMQNFEWFINVYDML